MRTTAAPAAAAAASASRALAAAKDAEASLATALRDATSTRTTLRALLESAAATADDDAHRAGVCVGDGEADIARDGATNGDDVE